MNSISIYNNLHKNNNNNNNNDIRLVNTESSQNARQPQTRPTSAIQDSYEDMNGDEKCKSWSGLGG